MNFGFAYCLIYICKYVKWKTELLYYYNYFNIYWEFLGLLIYVIYLFYYINYILQNYLKFLLFLLGQYFLYIENLKKAFEHIIFVFFIIFYNLQTVFSFHNSLISIQDKLCFRPKLLYTAQNQLLVNNISVVKVLVHFTNHYHCSD